MKSDAEFIEKVDKCNVCESKNFMQISTIWCEDLQRNAFETSYCSQCGSTFRSIRPRLTWYEELSTDSELQDIYDPDWEAARTYRYAQYAKACERWLRKGSRILDIGSNTGVGPLFLEKKGYQVFGIEQDKKRAEFSKALLKKPERIFSGSFERFNCDEKFDLILLSHVLEHLQNPTEMLRKIHSLLCVGGLLYVEVPDLAKAIGYADSFYASHMTNFTNASLRYILRRNGFEILKDLSSVFNNYDGTALGLVCRKTHPRTEEMVQPTLSFKSVQNRYKPMGARKGKIPYYFKIRSLTHMQSLGKAIFAYDQNKELYVVRKSEVAPYKRKSINEFAKALKLNIQRKWILKYSKIKYRPFLSEIQSVYNTLTDARLR